MLFSFFFLNLDQYVGFSDCYLYKSFLTLFANGPSPTEQRSEAKLQGSFSSEKKTNKYRFQIAASEQHGVQLKQTKAFHGNDLILVCIFCTFCLSVPDMRAHQTKQNASRCGGDAVQCVCLGVCTPPPSEVNMNLLWDPVVCSLSPSLIQSYA